MGDGDSDTPMRLAAFDHLRGLMEVHGHLTATELRPGFHFGNERIPLINPQRGIFKPRQMRHLLSIRTVCPRPGARVWYDDQNEVHRQIFEDDEAVDYAFMGQDPNAAENQWLRLHRRRIGRADSGRGMVADLGVGHADGPHADARCNGGLTRLCRDSLALRFRLTPMRGPSTLGAPQPAAGTVERAMLRQG